MRPDFRKAALITSTEDQVSCNLEGQSLLLQVSSGNYFGLNQVGSLVWESVQKGTTFDQIVADVLQAYDAERKRVEDDVEELLSTLESEGLIRVTDAGIS